MGRTQRKNAKRAEDEQFSFTVNGNRLGSVTVRNESYPNPSGHEYRVDVRGRAVIDCSCPHREHRGERCKHMIAVEDEVLLSLPNDYGVAVEPQNGECIDLSAQDKRDLRGALATELANAVEANDYDTVERLRDLRSRFEN